MRRRGAARVLALVTVLACGRRQEAMAPVPPPRSWEADLASHRNARDKAFATDPDSPIPEPRRASFRGLEYFAPDPSWRYAGWITRYPTATPMKIVTTNGNERPCERWGQVTFTREGRSLTLQVYRLLDMPDRPGGEGLFLPFKDRTTGHETYAAGRYVDLDGPDGGPFVLDFNRAYNPSCAYGDAKRFQCPATPAENTLSVAVEAGERGPAHAPEGASP